MIGEKRLPWRFISENYHGFSFLSQYKFSADDFQKAALSGGVAVGAIADLMIQPGGAFIAGTLSGVVSSLGYRVIQVINSICFKTIFRRVFDV